MFTSGPKDYRPVPDHEAELVMKVLGLMGDSTASRTIYLDGESGDEMSESDDGVGTYVDGQRNLRAGPRRRNDLDERQFLQQLVKNMTKMTAMNHPSAKRIRTEEDVHIDDVPGRNEDGEDDNDDRVPAADDIPEDDQPDEDEIGVENGPHEEEDDEDDIDVHDPDGGVRLSKRGTLKHEARTLEHLLTHRYKEHPLLIT